MRWLLAAVAVRAWCVRRQSLLYAHDLVGLPILLYKRNRPNQKGGYRGNNADACPDMEACRAVIREVAGRDHKMYARYHERFETKLADSHPKVRLAAVHAIKLVLTGFAEGHNPKPPSRGSSLIQALVARLNDDRQYVQIEARDLLTAINRMP